MLLNQAYRKHHKHWFDYNQHNTTDGEYLSYFDTSIVPSRGRVKNPSIIPKVPQKEKRVREPKGKVQEQKGKVQEPKGKVQEQKESMEPKKVL
jgi:hypothetical protein